MALDEIHVLGPEPDAHYACAELERPVGIDVYDLGLHAHRLYLDRVTGSDLARGLLILFGLFFLCLELSLLLVESSPELAAGAVYLLGLLILVYSPPHIVELCKGALGSLACLGDYALCLAAGLFVGLFEPDGELGAQKRRLLGIFLGLAQLPCRFGTVALKQRSCLLELFDSRLEARVLNAYARLRIVYYLPAQAETLGYGEGV